MRQLDKEWQRLTKAIAAHRTIVDYHYVVGFYRYWAKIDAIERALLKKGILTREEIQKEELPIIRAMQKDFIRKK